jgi:hypothetical protein
MATVTVIWKRNHREIRKTLDERIRRMLQLCADDIARSGFRGNVRVIFQTGKSRVQQRLLGLCCFFRPTPTIYIYTRYQRLKTLLETIAHEFGHVSHFVLYPKSRTHWTKEYREQCANRYEAIMMQHWNKVTA